MLTFPSPLSPAGAQPGHLWGHPDAGYCLPPSCADQGGVEPGKKEEGRDLSGLVTGKGPPMGAGGGKGEGKSLSASPPPPTGPRQAPLFWHSQPISWFSALSASLRLLPRPLKQQFLAYVPSHSQSHRLLP